MAKGPGRSGRKTSGWRGRHKRCEVDGCNKRGKYNKGKLFMCPRHYNYGETWRENDKL